MHEHEHLNAVKAADGPTVGTGAEWKPSRLRIYLDAAHGLLRAAEHIAAAVQSLQQLRR